MQHRVALFLCFLLGLSVWILLLSGRPNKLIQYTKSTNIKKSDTSDETSYMEDRLSNIHITPGALNKAQLLILEIARLKVKLEFLRYNFTFSGVDKLEDLLMEYRGTPVRSLIVSTWGSGDTFLGEMLNVMASNFYHYEPLLRYGMTQIRGSPHANESLRYIRSLFRCNENAMETFIRYWRKNVDNIDPVIRNTRLWNICEANDDLCLNSYFVTQICRLFPFQSMKVIRLRLSLAMGVLEDKRLNVKVVLLIRDPRAVMESRRDLEPACSTPDCMNPVLLCKDMVSDYLAAQRLSKKYPNRFMVVRYEELVSDINVIGLQLIKFLRLGPTDSFKEYLKENGDMDFKVSKSSIFKWLNDMDFHTVSRIQVMCKEAMRVWNYELAHNASHMQSKDFYPLQTHSVFPLALKDDDFDGAFNM